MPGGESCSPALLPLAELLGELKTVKTKLHGNVRMDGGMMMMEGGEGERRGMREDGGRGGGADAGGLMTHGGAALCASLALAGGGDSGEKGYAFNYTHCTHAHARTHQKTRTCARSIISPVTLFTCE